MLMTFARRPRLAAGQRGLSMIELMIGTAIGMFLVAGAVTVFVSNLGNSRRLLQEARVNQDLRAAADLISRDLRRAGYWGNAIAGTVVTAPATTATANPYRLVTDNVGTSTIEYNFSRDPAAAENNAIDTNECFGFRLSGGVIQMKTDCTPTWQAVTDSTTITVSALTITPTETPVDARDSCATACCSDADVAAGIPATCTVRNIAAGATCPRVWVRRYGLVLQGTAATDANVTRRLQTSVRVRNDEQSGVCPA